LTDTDAVTTSESERHALAEEELESRWEAAPAVLVIIAFQLTLAGISWLRDWKLWGLPWWVWTIAVPFEAILLTALAWDRARRALERIGRRRNVAILLLGLISLANAFALVALLGSLIGGHEQSGGQLLLKATTIWGTNVVVFGLWFWAVDRGGPIRRVEPHPPLPDFQFPQLDDPKVAKRGWRPELFDYIYVSFTNSIAFSPTDTLPLTRRAKLLMLMESAISAVTVLLVAARAVNILK
jgi:hypothetical protein